MNSWNFEATEHQVRAKRGDQQADLFESCMRSIADRQQYAGYHFYEFRRLLVENIDKKLDGKHLIQLALHNDQSEREKYIITQRHVAANVLACAQNLHCIADTLAHAVYYASSIPSSTSKLSERSISLPSVARALASTKTFASVGLALTDIASQVDFKYLSALINHSKHRSVIRARLGTRLDTPGDRPYALSFEPFTYDGFTYSAREVEALLEPFYGWFSFQIVDVGHALDSALLNDA